MSAGIDATVRQWSLLPDELRKSVKQTESEKGPEQEETNPGPALTEEEERELAELMDE